MDAGFVFDQPHYDALNQSREETISQLLGSISQKLDLRTALDIGCGVGHFSAFLQNLGYEVLALDGRAENIREAKRRYPATNFRVADAEDRSIRSLGTFDLVFCIGLFYHLENPFVAFRSLFEMTSKIAIFEGMCVPGEDAVLGVRDEGPSEDQGLRHVALYPTHNGLVKLLYRSGYRFVYRFRKPPSHDNYINSSLRKRSRTMVVAAITPLASDLLMLEPEPVTNPDPWEVGNSAAAIARRARFKLGRLRQFMRKPWPEKQEILLRRWKRRLSS